MSGKLPSGFAIDHDYFTAYEPAEPVPQVSIEEIRQQVTMPQVVSYYTPIPTNGKIHCLWHNDRKTPNLHIYQDSAFCFVCERQYDVFDFVMKAEGLDFIGAARFIAEHMGQFEDPARLPTACHKTSALYKGPVPRQWIDYWHEQLTPEKRVWLYEARLLTDETIDTKLLGWRPDYKAYVIPFWGGIPRHSEVITLQYRSTAESPPLAGPDWRYMGHSGYNRPSIIGSHLINPDLMIGVIGVLDQLLAEQDGLPVWSPNGATVFGNHQRLEALELQKCLAGVRHKVIVPDATPTEHVHAQRLAELVGGRVSYFPRDFGGKDYTDFRLLGFTPEDFVRMVLQDENEFMYLLDSSQVENCRLLLMSMSEGNAQEAFEILKIVVETVRHQIEAALVYPRISHTLQLLSVQALYPEFSPTEWDLISDEFFQARNFPQMAGVLQRWGEVAASRRGAF